MQINIGKDTSGFCLIINTKLKIYALELFFFYIKGIGAKKKKTLWHFGRLGSWEKLLFCRHPSTWTSTLC